MVPGLNLGGESALGHFFLLQPCPLPLFYYPGCPISSIPSHKPLSPFAPLQGQWKGKKKKTSRREGKIIKMGLQPLAHFCNEPPPAPISLLSYFTAGYLFLVPFLLGLSPVTRVRKKLRSTPLFFNLRWATTWPGLGCCWVL